MRQYMTTYTIAYDTDSSMLFVTIPDGSDLESALTDEEENAGIEINRDELTVEEGLILTDEPEDDDDIRYSGTAMGYLTDESGETFEYAVRRK